MTQLTKKIYICGSLLRPVVLGQALSPLGTHPGYPPVSSLSIRSNSQLLIVSPDFLLQLPKLVSAFS